MEKLDGVLYIMLNILKLQNEKVECVGPTV